MFKQDTLKTKTFIVGLLNVIGGVVLAYKGLHKEGIALIDVGVALMVIRDAIIK